MDPVRSWRRNASRTFPNGADAPCTNFLDTAGYGTEMSPAVGQDLLWRGDGQIFPTDAQRAETRKERRQGPSGFPLPPGFTPAPPSPEQMPMPFASKGAAAVAKKPGPKVAQRPGRKPQKGASLQPALPAQQGFRVVISHLPVRLMSAPMMMAMVENALSKDDVLSIDVWSGYSKGEAIVECSSAGAATTLVEHCHGCNWNPGGVPVTASMQGDAVQHQALPETAKSASTSGAAWLGGTAFERKAGRQTARDATQMWQQAPAHVQLCTHGNSIMVNSDASTNVSDSESRGEWMAS